MACITCAAYAAPAIAAATGHDWLFLDNEHGAFSVSEIAQLCIASLPTGVTPLVRVCANAIDEATRALDNGALGIVMPHVDTAEEARRIAEAFRYPPRVGEAGVVRRRSMAFSRRRWPRLRRRSTMKY